jgi:histidinol-phosphate/aromatic aminotransferase/cobyric acid decarboxylase-like protein
LLLGNGASELLDLITSMAPPGPFKGVLPIQYREYQRASEAHERSILAPDDPAPAAILTVINPSNPTGAYWPLEELKRQLETRALPNSVVMVDESMLPWVGPHWRHCSLLSQRAWVDEMLTKRQVQVFVIHSWTKIWACPGLRLGSVLCPSEALCKAMKKRQVPWSVNTAALAFLAEVVHDEEYLLRTWELTPQWRAAMCDFFAREFPSWKLYGEPWTSWIWMDVQDAAVAKELNVLCNQAGVPIRLGADGYNSPTFIRLGVRSPDYQSELFNTFKLLKSKK